MSFLSYSFVLSTLFPYVSHNHVYLLSFFFFLPYQIPSSSSSLNLISEEEAVAIMTHANDCLESECSLDEVDELISALKDQQRELQKRVDDVGTMIQSLEKVNSSGSGREVDEVRETVRAIFRVFQLGDKASGNDYPALTKPTGYSGEVGKGSTTAYDALPPKKWKNPSP